MWDEGNFYDALTQGNLATVEACLKTHPEWTSIHFENASNGTPLLCAADNGHSEMVNWLLSKGASLLEKDKDGMTALLCAAYRGHVGTLELLLSHGASLLEKEDGYEKTALLIAAEGGQTAAVECLLLHGASLLERDKGEMTALLWAAYRGHVGTLEFLLSHGASLLEKDNGGRTALLLAAEQSHVGTLELLLSHGASLLEKDANGNTLLLRLAYGGHTTIIEWLLPQGVSLLEKNNNGNTALLLAAYGGHIGTVELLLSHGASLLEKDKDGMTALLLAAYGGHTEIVQWLLSRRGASLLEKSNDGATALLCAADEGHIETVEWLLSQDVSLLEKNKAGRTALLLAAQNGHTAMVECLLSHGASLLEKDEYGRTALLLAAQEGHTAIVKYLLSHYASLLEKDKGGMTALLWAAYGGHIGTVEWLLSQDVSLLEKNKAGRTALLLAAQNGHTAMVECLLSHGASLLEKDEYGRTALLLAAQEGHTAIVRCLLSHHASLLEKDKDGMTALLWAAYGGHIGTVEWLLSHGASLVEEDDNGATALLLAASEGHTETVECLLSHGASLLEKNKRGDMTLLRVASLGRAKGVKCLLLHGISLLGEAHQAYLQQLRLNLKNENPIAEQFRAEQFRSALKQLGYSPEAFFERLSIAQAEGLLMPLPHKDSLFAVPFPNRMTNPSFLSASVDMSEVELAPELQLVLKHLTIPLPEGGCRNQLWIPSFGWRGLSEANALQIDAKKQNQEGQRRVNYCSGAHFKFSPLKPGLEFAVDRLVRLVFGAGHTSATTLFVLRRVTHDGTVKSEWGIASKTVEIRESSDKIFHGYSVRTALKQQPLSNFRVDPDSFTAQFLISLLTLPFDGKTDNYFILPRPMQEESGVWLVGIDNDLAFYPPWVKRIDGEHVPFLRSFLLMLSQMHTPLSLSIRALFLRQTPRLAMLEWLSQLDYLSQFYMEHADFFGGKLGTHRFLPVHFAEGIIPEMWDRWERLYSLLQTEKVLTHHTVLIHLYPEMACYYEGIQRGIEEQYWIPYWENRLAQQGLPWEEITQSCATLNELEVAMNVILGSAEAGAEGSLEFLERERLLSEIPLLSSTMPCNELDWKEWEQRVAQQGWIHIDMSGTLQVLCTSLDIETYLEPIQEEFFRCFETMGGRLQRIRFEQVTTPRVRDSLLRLLKVHPQLTLYIGDILLNPIQPEQGWAYCLQAINSDQRQVLILLQHQGYLEQALGCLKPSPGENRGEIDESDARKLLCYLFQALNEQAEAPFKYQQHYGALAPQWRAIFLEILSPQPELVALLLVYPSKDGYRLGFSAHEEEWSIGLDSLFQGSSGPLSCRYFSCGTWNLRTGYLNNTQRQNLKQRSILTTKDRFDFSKQAITGLSGNHLVFFFPHPNFRVHIKVAPEFPGMELAIALLARRCVGIGVTPRVSVGRWHGGQQVTPVLLSETIKGLLTTESPMIWRHLNSKAFSRLFVLTLLTNPEDQKPDNLVGVPLTERGETTYALVSIDNDRAFVPPFEGTHLRVKSMVYCCDEMQQPLHPEVREELLALSPYHIIQGWLNELEQANKGLQQLFNEKVLKASFEAKVANQRSYLRGLLKRDTVIELFSTLQTLQSLLRQGSSMSLFDILGKIKGTLAQHYHRAYEHSAHPLDRFEWATHTEYQIKRVGQVVYYTSTLDMKGYLKSLQGAEVKSTALQMNWQQNLKQAQQELLTLAIGAPQLENVRVQLEQGQMALFQDLPTDYAREQVLNRIDFRTLVDENNMSGIALHRAILSSVVGTSFLELRLKHVVGLDNVLLEALVRSTFHLKVLDLTGCTRITALPYLDIYTPYLERLNLSKTGANTVIFKTPMAHLLELRAEDCVALQDIYCEAPRLSVLQLKGHVQLKRFHLSAPHLMRLDLQGQSWFEYLYLQSSRFAWVQAAWDFSNLKAEQKGGVKEITSFLFYLLVHAVETLWDAQGGPRTFPYNALVRFFRSKEHVLPFLPEIGIVALAEEKQNLLALAQLSFYLVPFDPKIVVFLQGFLERLRAYDQPEVSEAVRRALLEISDFSWYGPSEEVFRPLLGALLGEAKAPHESAARSLVRMSRRSPWLKAALDENLVLKAFLKNAFAAAEQVPLPSKKATPTWFQEQYHLLQSEELEVQEKASWALEIQRNAFHQTVLQGETVAARWAWLFPDLAHAIKQLYQRYYGSVKQVGEHDLRVVLLDVENILVNSKGQLNYALIWTLKAHGIKKVILLTSYSLSWNLKHSLEKNTLRSDIVRRLRRYGVEVVAVQTSGAPYYLDKTLGVYYQTVVEPIEREARALADAGMPMMDVMAQIQARHQKVINEEAHRIKEGIQTEDPRTRGGKQHLLEQLVDTLPDECHVFVFDDKYEVIQYVRACKSREKLKERRIQLTPHEVFFGHQLESPLVYEKAFQGPNDISSLVLPWLSAKEGGVAWVRLQWIAGLVGGEWVLDQERIRVLKIYQHVVLVDEDKKTLEFVAATLLQQGWKAEIQVLASEGAGRDIFADWMFKQEQREGVKGLQVHIFETSKLLRTALCRDYGTDASTIVINLRVPFKEALQWAWVGYERDRWGWVQLMFKETPLQSAIQQISVAFESLTTNAQASLLFVLRAFRSAVLETHVDEMMKAESTFNEFSKVCSKTKIRFFENREQKQVRAFKDKVEDLLKLLVMFRNHMVPLPYLVSVNHPHRDNQQNDSKSIDLNGCKNDYIDTDNEATNWYDYNNDNPTLFGQNPLWNNNNQPANNFGFG